MTDAFTRISRPVGFRAFGLLSGVSAVSVIAASCAVSPARAGPIDVIDVIPNAASVETSQNSEPSIAVDPLNPNNMISAAFGVSPPYWISTNGGTTWSGFGNLPSVDKSLAWRQDGVAALTTTLNPIGASLEINTFQSGATSFGSAINTFNPGQRLDQPWVRTGPGGQTYLAYNNLSNAGGKTASMIISANNGTTYGPQITLETITPAGGQDAPSVRQAVNGSTVYAAFTRWGTPSAAIGGTVFLGSQVVVVKSINSGASFSSGVSAATTTGYFVNASDRPLTLGQQRTSSDLAIAVDPNNANHVVVAYGNVPASGQLQLNVIESTNGGANWSTPKFTTPLNVRSGLLGISILANGDIGLLYAQYNPTTNALSQHLVTTTDDFATTTDTLLGTQSNATPIEAFFPYIGDFYDLTSIGDTLYGIFSASNADNGTLASYPEATFQRDFTGIPDTASFQLTDLTGAPVAFSIDPFSFSLNLVPEPATLSLLGVSLLGLAGLRRRRR